MGHMLGVDLGVPRLKKIAWVLFVVLFVSLSGCSFVTGSQRAAQHVRTLTAHHTTAPTCLLHAMQVLYLVLVQFLDSRGGEMQPPPPEAFGL